MRRNSLVVAIMVVISVAGICAHAATRQIFLENFGIFPQWAILHPDPKNYSVGPMYLNLWTLPGGLEFKANDYKNLFVIPNPLHVSDPANAKDFQITIRVTGFKPVVHAQQVVIIAYDNDDNFVRCSNGYIDGRNWELCKEVNGVFFNPIRNGTNANDHTFWMRLVKKGNVYYNYYSLDGTNFAQLNNISYPNPNPKYLGICAIAGNTTAPPVPVFIDFFRVEEITP